MLYINVNIIIKCLYIYANVCVHFGQLRYLIADVVYKCEYKYKMLVYLCECVCVCVHFGQLLYLIAASMRIWNKELNESSIFIILYANCVNENAYIETKIKYRS